MRCEKNKGWAGYWPDDAPPGLRSIAELLTIAGKRGDVVKDDHRSLVKVIVNDERRIVAKQPRDKNRRRWIRLLSLVRESAVTRTLRGLSALRRADVATVSPIAAVENRRWGMVLDSWLFYFYRDGRPCSEAEFPMLIEVLRAVHRAGFRHGDPHLDNFLFDGEQVFVIDFKAKPRLTRVSDYRDLLLLEHKMKSHSDIVESLDIDTASPSYWIARAYRRYSAARNWVKLRLRTAGVSKYRGKYKAQSSQK